MPSTLPPLQWDSFLHHWHVQPLWSALALLLVAGYVAGLTVARRRGRPTVPPARIASFLVGIGLLLVTVTSAISTYAMAVFWDHMVEHLLLIMVVPALLVLGHPVSVLGGLGAARDRWSPRTASAWPWNTLIHPLTGFALYAAVIVGTHLTGFMDAMASHPWLMGAEQWLYLGTGYLYLLPLLCDEPIRWRLPHLGRLVLLMLGMIPDTIVGIVLMQTTSDLFPKMEAGHPAWAPAPVDDLHLGGALMWAGGDGLMMLFAIGVTIALITHSESTSVLGHRLEAVRRRTLAEHVARSGETPPATVEADVDQDDELLVAYNRMLARMTGATADGTGPRRPRPRERP